MTYQGRFHNGVVILEGGAALPEGTPVTVQVEQRRVRATIDEIASLPIEGSPEPCSGRDHDKILYGKP